ncbi:MAG: alpha-amylase family glycosyl hydrolase [Balneola sp.]
MRKLTGLVVLFLIWGCSSEKNIKYGDQIVGLGSPITLGYDSTIVIMEDYFMDPSTIDDVSTPSSITYYLTDGNSKLVLKGDISGKLDVISFHDGDVSYDILLKKTSKQEVTFSLEDKGYDLVQIKGEMNAWNPNASDFKKENGTWTFSMLVNEGLYQYLFVVDGEEMIDPSNSETVSNGMGGFNNLLTVGNIDAEKPKLDTYDFSDERVYLQSNEAENVIALWENHQLKTEFKDDIIRVYLPENSDLEGRTHIRAWTFNENGISNDVLIPLENGKVLDGSESLTRKDVRAWNMYFVLIDRFKDGNPSNTRKVDDPDIHPKANYYGGDLAGITQKIKDGYFDKINVNALWLSPISQNPEDAWGLWDKGGVKTKFSGYHGYWPVSSSKIDDRFGTSEEFKELLSVAHENGMAVILDYVANHVHKNHPVYQRNPEWATDLYLPDGRMNTELWDEQRVTTWFDTFMPSLDFSNPEVIETMTDSALFWVEEYELDGFRHDATKHIQLEFWRTLTRKVKEEIVVPENRQVFQVGETYGSRELVASYINSGMLESQFDFSMYDAGLNAFGQDLSFEGLQSQLQESFNYFGYHNMMGIISGNHDKPRFITLTSGEVKWNEDSKLAGWTREIGAPQAFAYDRLSLLLAFNLTIPGIPVTYMGDEFGMPGANDPDNRRWMRFEDSELSQLELRNRSIYSKLSELRTSEMSILFGDFQFLKVEDDVMAYSRAYFAQQTIVVFNKSKTQQQVSVDLRPGFDYSKLADHFGNTFSVEGNTLTVTLPSNSFEILTL